LDYATKDTKGTKGSHPRELDVKHASRPLAIESGLVDFGDVRVFRGLLILF